MSRRGMALGAVFVLLFTVSLLYAQISLPSEVRKHGYADLVLINGKIVSMDDAGVNTNVGTVYQAMAVKGTRIISLGTGERIRALADSDTRIVDLQGRLVLPGIIESHAHLFGGGGLEEAVGLRAAGVGAQINVQAGRDLETTRLKIETAIQEAVKKVEPEKWIVVGVSPNEEERVSSQQLFSWINVELLAPKERIDRIAPDHPVLVRSGPGGNLNSKGFEMGDRFVPNFTEYVLLSMGSSDYVDEVEKGLVGVSAMTSINWDIWRRDQPNSLVAEMIRRDLERAAAHGLTTFSSRVPHPRVMDGFVLLNRENALPVRFAALYEVHRRPADPDAIRQFYKMTGNLTGLGDDRLWVHGVASELFDSIYPQACLGKDVEAPPKIKAREMCQKPGDMFWDVLQTAMESGWRLAGIHGVGSDGVRRFIQLIERAMKNTRMTAEDVRKLRPTVEHAPVLGKLPDVVEGLKKYGIIVSVWSTGIEQAPQWIADYGPAIEPFIVPVKSWLNQGVKVVGQVHSYRGIGASWLLFMTRQMDDKGNVITPQEALDRVTVLKMWTTWASEYVMKEKDMGTLETGKLADFVVLDRDYFTIPLEEIPKIRPQMTVMDGQIRYLGADFAQKQGMQPVGYQFPEGYEPWDSSGGGGGGM